MDLRQMAKTPTEIEVDGKTYKMAPFELCHLAEIEQWADDRQFEKLRGKITKLEQVGLEEDALSAAVAKLVEAADAATRDPKAKAAEMQSVAGILKGVRVSLTVHHPKLSDSEFARIVKVYGMKVLETKIDKLNDLGEAEGNAPGRESPAP